jgi:cobalt-zinc-cadmium efflux system membrane fusion protein
LKVRAELANADGRLRSGTFGTGRIILRDEPGAVVVPNTAIHWDGSCHVVFVRDKQFLEETSPKVFHTRTVRPGARDARFTEVIAGLLPGEVVASRGSGILQAALLKNNLGAG